MATPTTVRASSLPLVHATSSIPANMDGVLSSGPTSHNAILRALRADRNMSLQDIADAIGTQAQVVELWEREEHRPKKCQREALARVFEELAPPDLSRWVRPCNLAHSNSINAEYDAALSVAAKVVPFLKSVLADGGSITDAIELLVA